MSCINGGKTDSVCFFRHRSIANSFILPCDGVFRVYFENVNVDSEMESTIAVINQTFPPTDCIITLQVERNDGTSITVEIPPPPELTFVENSKAISLHDLRRVSIACSGSPGDTCRGAISLSQIMCECLECEARTGVKTNGETGIFRSCCNNESNCSMQFDNLTPFFELRFQQRCDGSTQTIYENFSIRDSLATLQVSNFSITSPDCTMTAILETRDGKILERIVNTGSSESFIVEGLLRFSIRCDGDPDGICAGGLSGNRQFCMCCCDERKEPCNSHNIYFDKYIKYWKGFLKATGKLNK